MRLWKNASAYWKNSSSVRNQTSQTWENNYENSACLCRPQPVVAGVFNAESCVLDRLRASDGVHVSRAAGYQWRAREWKLRFPISIVRCVERRQSGSGDTRQPKCGGEQWLVHHGDG